MSHVPCIDDLMELTKTTRQASEISAKTTLLAETLLVTKIELNSPKMERCPVQTKVVFYLGLTARLSQYLTSVDR